MVSIRQVHFIEEHWQAIARRSVATIRHEMGHSHALSDAMILERVDDLFGHLGDWLSAPVPERLASYETVGQKRAAAHVHLYDLVRMLQIIRLCAIDYVRENELSDNSITLRAQNELEYAIDRFFDLVIYHTVKGYESSMSLALAARAS